MTTRSLLESYNEMTVPQLQTAIRSLPLDAPDIDTHLFYIRQHIREIETFLEEIRTAQQKRTSTISTASSPESLLYGCRQYRLLIGGSRQATDEMLNKAAQAVLRADANGWAVMVGDAEGVDTAVMQACNQLRVNYVCCGISEQPRSTAFYGVKQGGIGRYLQIKVEHAGDYSTRDHYLADNADRGFFIWNGNSKGTKAVYEYINSLDKPADLLDCGKPKLPPVTSNKETKQHPSPVVVEVVVDAAPGTESAMQGIFGLRALDGMGKVMYQAAQTFTDLDVSTPDYAKIQVMLAALERLNQHLNGETATYTLRIIQSSKNVEGWLGKSWKRNADTVKKLAGKADKLLKSFPDVEWIKMPRAQVLSCLSKIN